MRDAPAVRRPYLCVMTSDVLDAVHHAGGLIFDRGRLGWQVIVLTATGVDTRPLEILGAELGNIDTPPADHRERRTALMTSAGSYRDNRNTRIEVESALSTKTTEVLVWGPAPTDRLDHDGRLVSYRLSSAARAFKTHALIAAGLPADVDLTETFRTRCGPDVISPELVAAG